MKPTDRMLAPELESVRPLAQLLPQQALGQGQIATQARAPAGRSHFVSIDGSGIYPSTMLRMVPLPMLRDGEET